MVWVKEKIEKEEACRALGERRAGERDGRVNGGRRDEKEEMKRERERKRETAVIRKNIK